MPKSFSFRTGLVLSGSILGQAVAFILLPFIARLYGAETIGQVSATLAMLNIFSLIACWQYDQAVIVAQDKDLNHLLFAALILICTLSLGLGLLLFLVSRLYPAGLVLLNQVGLNYYLIILLLPYAIFLLLTNLRLRNNHLWHVSSARLLYYGGTAILQTVIAIRWSATIQAFLLSQAVASGLAIIILFPYQSVPSWWRSFQLLGVKEVTQRMVKVARTYIDFPKYQAPAQILNAFSLNLPVLVLNAGFSATWAGWYFMANRLLAVPTFLLSQAIGQVFYRDSAERERTGISQAQVLERTASTLIKLSLFFGVALGSTAPFWVRIVLGEEWLPVATILQILLLVFVVTFFTSPFSTMLNVKGQQKGALKYYALLTLARTVAILVAWRLQSEWLLVWLYTIASLSVMVPLFRYIVHSAGGSVRHIVSTVYPLLIELTIMLAVALLLTVLGLRDRLIGVFILATMLFLIAILQLVQFP